MHATREARRRDLYRPGADASTLLRYRRPRRAQAVLAASAAVVLLVVVALLIPSLLGHSSVPTLVGPRVRGSIAGPEAFGSLAAARDGLPAVEATAHGAGTDRIVVNLDRFGQVVEGESRFVVLVACSTGRFRLRLSTVTQGRSQILLEPLKSATGPCTGVQRFRYRPLLGLIPTALEVEATGPVRAVALITA